VLDLIIKEEPAKLKALGILPASIQLFGSGD
jgi:hypothetical protein